MPLYRLKGFTLAELLIALAILGVIATFTIPKVLQAQQDGRYKAMGKEAATMVSVAYQSYRLKNTLSASTGMDDLTPYLNYVRKDTASVVNDTPPGGPPTWNCSDTANNVCLVLHNGGFLIFHTNSGGNSFQGTSNLHGIIYGLDPDGTGPQLDQAFVLYFNGKLTSFGDMEPNTTLFGSPGWQPNPLYNTTWFSWN